MSHHEIMGGGFQLSHHVAMYPSPSGRRWRGAPVGVCGMLALIRRSAPPSPKGRRTRLRFFADLHTGGHRPPLQGDKSNPRHQQL